MRRMTPVSEVDDPAAKVERSRSVWLLLHSGQSMVFDGLETGWSRAKT